MESCSKDLSIQKYKVGDKVIIGNDLSDKPNGGAVYVMDLDRYKGQIHTISRVKFSSSGCAVYELEGMTWSWINPWLLPLGIPDKYIVETTDGNIFVSTEKYLVSRIGTRISKSDYNDQLINTKHSVLNVRRMWGKSSGNNAFSPDKYSLIFEEGKWM